MHKEEPPAPSVSLKSAPATIYTQTIQFLLQNNALQVKHTQRVGLYSTVLT